MNTCSSFHLPLGPGVAGRLIVSLASTTSMSHRRQVFSEFVRSWGQGCKKELLLRRSTQTSWSGSSENLP